MEAPAEKVRLTPIARPIAQLKLRILLAASGVNKLTITRAWGLNGMWAKLLIGVAGVATIVAAAHAQVNNFPLMVGRWVHTSPEPGNTTPSGHQIIVAADGSVFTSSNTVKGAFGRCTDAGANFCLEGVDGAERRFKCAYDIAFLAGPGSVVTSLNFRLVRESEIVPCPRGIFSRAL